MWRDVFAISIRGKWAQALQTLFVVKISKKKKVFIVKSNVTTMRSDASLAASLALEYFR